MALSLSTNAGQQLFDLGKTRVGERYILGAVAPKDKADYHGPWDCAEFTSWLVFQISGRLYGCNDNHGNPRSADAFTGFYHRDAHSIGKIIPISEAAATKGAFLLRTSVPRLMGHIVVSDGKGGTVEANGKNTGVITSILNGRRWDSGILIPGINYGSAQSPIVVAPPQKIVFRVTTPFMKSPVIGQIQTALLSAGFDPRGIDNTYGLNTAKAVIAFQEINGLVTDGEVGEKTAAALGITL